MLIYDGKSSQPERVTLRAGHLLMEFEEGRLMYVRAGNQEILRRVYIGVRDENWGTIPPRLSDVRMDVQADAFRVTFKCDHVLGAVNFTWRGEITGGADSTVRFSFDGQAVNTFKSNRIGFCVL
ncbi:MAG: hypothetical protein IAE80_14340, partial [Anaerolinea sp.]|nr:hypothetical protein [Anaerolinea sp.]